MAISDDDIARLLGDESGPEQNDPPADHGSITDLTNAELLAERHGHNLHYCYPWGQWLTWSAGRWAPDEQGLVEHLAKQILRRQLARAAQIEDDRERTKRIRELMAAERASRIRGCLELARSEPAIPVLPSALDADQWALNLLNGTIDLRTAQLRPHRRGDLLTRQAPVEHNKNAAAPVWDAFLTRALPDPDVRAFAQRAAGYSLTGNTNEQILLILYGSGANGKSTFLELLLHLLGDYAQQAPPETFLAKHDGIPNDVARLRGARFVSAVEVGEGRRLNEPLIKRMTGGDTMTARFMRQEYFEFEPQFTPWLATNHKPEIRGTDEAIWRRIRLIPFTETIPLPERDPELKSKLRNELPGILNWALSGCLDWQNDGLAAPAAVTAATKEYRDDQDLLGAFITDTCDETPTNRCLAAPLYTAYRAWAKENGDEPLTSQSLGRRLTERGYGKTRDRLGRGWTGIGLKDGQEHLI